MEKAVGLLTELPPELQSEILVRLPAKSLLLCKCVCKSLRILIQNPTFVQTHLSRFTSPSKSIILQLIGGWDPHPYHNRLTFHHFLVSVDPTTKDEEVSSLPLTPPVPSDHPYLDVDVVGSCNGLILFSVRERGPDCWLILWNPVIGQSRFLPKPNHKSCDFYEFGFIPETNDYVVLKIGYEQALIEVYKMSIDSWVTINCSSRGADLIKETLGGFNPVFLNGSFHWDTCAMNGNDIVYYNLIDEEFGVIEGLDNSKVITITEYRNHSVVTKLDVVNESLAMIYWLRKSTSTFEIWVMNEYGFGDSWTLKFLIRDNISDYLNGDLVRRYCTSGIVRGDPPRNLCPDEYIIFLSHDLNTTSVIKIPRIGRDMGCFCSFVETLVPVTKVD